MDNKTIQKGIQGLKWEAKYSKEAAEEEKKKSYFLSALDCLDTDFEKCIECLKITPCSTLDVGTGMGEQAFYLAQKGFNVTATDVSATAIKKAKKKFQLPSVNIRFIEDNILESNLNSQFDLIMDRGCLTLIPDNLKLDYLESIKKLLAPNGWLLIKADRKRILEITHFITNAGLCIHLQHETIYNNRYDVPIKAIFFAVQKNSINR